MQLRFSKMHGLGNDFVVVDCLSQSVNLQPRQIRNIANRRTGIGCDQLLLVEPPRQPDVDFHYRIFNQDGSEAEQCGNGARCFARFVADHKLSGKSTLRISTNTGVIGVTRHAGNEYSVDMGMPDFEPASIPLEAEANQEVYEFDTALGPQQLSAVSMGNPHAVLLVDSIDTAAVNELGPVLEAHGRFPQRANVGFMEIVDRDHIRLRVYERGVGETQACGTGACAAVAVGIRRGLLDESVSVALTGGKLLIEWKGPGHSLVMTGPASNVFDGKISI